MKRTLLTAASLAIATGMAATGAMAANYAQPAAGTVVYGPLRATPPAGAIAPQAPPGFKYEWVFSYEHHGYHAHWEAIRIHA